MGRKPPPTLGGIEEAARVAKRAAIVQALREHGGNRTRAALALGYGSPSNLRRAAERLGLELAAPELAAPEPTEVGALRLTDAEKEERERAKPAPKTKPKAKAKKAAKRAARGKR